MIFLERVFGQALGLVGLLVCIGVFFASIHLARYTNPPERKYESTLQDQIQRQELELFDAIERAAAYDPKELEAVRSELMKAKWLRLEADQVYDSIRVGEVIARNGVGGHRPVGKYKTVDDLRDKASIVEAKAIRRARAIVREVRAAKASTQNSPSRLRDFDLTKSLEELEKLHDRNAWYYSSAWGIVVKLVNALLKLLAFASGALSILIIFSGAWVPWDAE